MAVEAASAKAGAQAEVKIYTADSDGCPISDIPFWWTNSAERKTLQAWCCGDGSSAVGEGNASAVQADQSGRVGWLSAEQPALRSGNCGSLYERCGGALFGSSSEASDGNARFWDVRSNGRVRCDWSSKGSDLDVRPVLAL